MRASVLSASLRFAAMAMALGLAGAVQAADVPVQRATSAIQQSHPSAADTARIDWNIDYPSQLGPEGPVADRASSVPPATAIALARQPAQD